MSELIKVEIKDKHVAILTLNRPEAANAMSKSLLEKLNEQINKMNQRDEIYCVIISGEGERAFCAGADLKERKGMTENQVIDAVRYIGDTVTNIENMKVPVIAAINGSAFGGGLELALACDIRIAAEDIKLGLTETSLAIIPGAGGTQRLPRIIGLGQAKRMIYTAKPITAQQALSFGLVDQTVGRNDLLAESLSLAKTIAANGPIAVRQAKIAINRGIEMSLISGLEFEHKCYLETIPTTDRLEGLNAFQEKRKPQYIGK